jgi:hypothetical protein
VSDSINLLLARCANHESNSSERRSNVDSLLALC